jgi:hypothetical protein
VDDRAALEARARELEAAITVARQALVQREAAIRAGDRAAPGRLRRSIGHFDHLILGALMMIAVMVAAWLAGTL